MPAPQPTLAMTRMTTANMPMIDMTVTDTIRLTS